MAKFKKTDKPKPQEQKKHPDRWEQDLNPHRLEGQNMGRQNNRDLDLRSASDVKELPECLSQFRQEELAQIAIVPSGSRLQQGAVYLDLRNVASGPITAIGNTVVQEHNLYVPKDETPYDYWNRLIDFARSGSASSGSVQAKHGESSEVSEELIDQTLADSFPASDPPFWTTGRDRPSK